MAVEPNSIYLIPPKKEMIISGGRLLLTDKDPDQELTLPIDISFARSPRTCGSARSRSSCRAAAATARAASAPSTRRAAW